MEDLVTAAEAALMLGVGPSRVRQWVSEQRLVVARRIRGAILLRRNDVEAFAKRPCGRPRKAVPALAD